MVDGRDPYIRMHDALRMANAECEQIGPTGAAAGEAEGEYRAALRNAIMRLRADGIPATLVKDIAKGEEQVVRAWVRYCTAEAIHKATIEAEMLHKKEADIYRDEVNRGWANA